MGEGRESRPARLSGPAGAPLAAYAAHAGGYRPPVAKTLFVTGKLAEPALRSTLERMAPEFPYEVAVLRITVAALMTTSWIARHLSEVAGCEPHRDPGPLRGRRPGHRGPLGRPDREGARRPPRPARALRAGGAPRGVRRARHPDLRRDQQRAVPLARGGGAPGGVLPAERRRRDRPRLLPRPEVRRRGRSRGPPEEPGLHPQHRHARSGRDRRRRPGGHRLRAEPQRPEPRRGRPAPRHAGPHPRLAGGARHARPEHGAPRDARGAPTSSTR